MISLAKMFSIDFQACARRSQTLQVLTIDYSHFCEFALWALKEQKVPFEEHGYAPGQHVLPVLSVRVGNKNEKHLSSSSRIVPVQSPGDESCERLLAKEEVAEKENKAKPAATAVPLAILPNGNVLRDSWEIAEYPGILAPVHPELKALLDKEIGPLSRQLVYAFFLKDVNRPHWDMLCTYRRHWLWRFLWWIGVGNSITERLKKTFQPHDLEAVSRCREKLLVAIRKLDEWIDSRCFDLNPTVRDPQKPLSMADIAVASLLSPVLMPPKYLQGKYNNLFQNFEKNDFALSEELVLWRNTRSGKYVLELYDKYR